MEYVFRHLRTILKHKWIVLKECIACGYFWRGLVHDLSKFSPAEFIPSAKYFQGDRSPIEAEKEAIGYSEAWLHHKAHNKHHWEYWCDFDDKTGEVIPNKIPYKYVVEMICDWIAAGKVYGKEKWTECSPLEYYIKVRKGRHFHPSTDLLILGFLYELKSGGLKNFHKMAKSRSKYCIKEKNNYGWSTEERPTKERMKEEKWDIQDTNGL